MWTIGDWIIMSRRKTTAEGYIKLTFWFNQWLFEGRRCFAANVDFSRFDKVSFVGLFVFVNMIINCFILPPPPLFILLKHFVCVSKTKKKCWLKLNGKLMYIIEMNWSRLLYVLNYWEKKIKKRITVPGYLWIIYRKHTIG